MYLQGYRGFESLSLLNILSILETYRHCLRHTCDGCPKDYKIAMKKNYIGTAGWFYQDWIGSFYPQKQTKSFDWLSFYSQFFNVVEVNASFYTYINPKVVDSWINKVSDVEDFQFTMKLHQDFTHKRFFTEEQTSAVKYCLDKFQKANRLGGLLLQFPYSFELSTENANHLKNLVDTFSEYEKFIEVRHKSLTGFLISSKPLSLRCVQ